MKAIHDEHLREGLMLLSDLDACLEARSTGTDPRTGKPPRTAKQSEALTKLYQEEIPRLERAFADHMAAYADAFGRDAATAFEEAIRTWHAGGLVTSERCPIVSPLPEAIERAAFGHEEDGTIVSPDENEVREITEAVAEELCDLAVPETRQPLVDKFADDFGREASQNLERWAERKVQSDDQEYSYGPGEPWHYYSRGDGATPIPVDQIPPAERASETFFDRLPKKPEKRKAALLKMIDDQETQLRDRKEKYALLLEKGADALSDYDRNIAHGGDAELGWACAVSLMYRQIAFGSARLAAMRHYFSDVK